MAGFAGFTAQVAVLETEVVTKGGNAEVVAFKSRVASLLSNIDEDFVRHLGLLYVLLVWGGGAGCGGVTWLTVCLVVWAGTWPIFRPRITPMRRRYYVTRQACHPWRPFAGLRSARSKSPSGVLRTKPRRRYGHTDRRRAAVCLVGSR